MRIRKRFPLSSLASSVSLSVVSDPQLNHSLLVQPTTSQLHPITNKRVQEANTDSQPSDPPNQPPIIVVGDNFNNTSHKFEIRQKEGEQIKLEESSREEEGNTRKQNIFLAGVLTPISSHQVDERWFDGDKKIPLKKRKGVIVEKTREETLVLEKEKKMKSKMKSKTNKKCSTTMVHHNHGEQDKAGNDDNNYTINISVKKINKRGGAIMEGSRCSRVNGRGWRCCQQTLVGYSLCEHHLGKGRLRSITSVKGRAKVPTTVAPTTIAPHNDNTTNNVDQSARNVFVSSSSMVQPARVYKETILLDGSCYDDHEDEDEEEDDDDDYNDEDLKKPLFVKKKRMKLGMVKARSLSSLLNQTNNEVVVAVDDN